MSRLIIENRTDMSDADALEYARIVVANGRTDGKDYCYCTVFNNATMVSAFRNKASDRLVVHYELSMTNKGN